MIEGCRAKNKMPSGMCYAKYKFNDAMKKCGTESKKSDYCRELKYNFFKKRD